MNNSYLQYYKTGTASFWAIETAQHFSISIVFKMTKTENEKKKKMEKQIVGETTKENQETHSKAMKLY